MNHCILKINEAMHSLSKQELKVATYVIKHPKEAASMTIANLSKKCKVSTATVVRFCQSIGYSSFRDFIMDLYHEVANEEHNVQQSIYDIENPNTKNLSIEETITMVTTLNIASLKATIDVLNNDEVKKAVDLIDKANKVFIYALSGSAMVAHDAEYKFRRIGIDCQAFDNPHAEILSSMVIKKEDVALFISYTGETVEIIKTAQIIKDKNIPIISITRFGENPLSMLSDIKLQHSSIGKGLKTYSTRSRTPQHNLIDIIFVALCQRRGQKLKEYYKLLY